VLLVDLVIEMADRAHDELGERLRNAWMILGERVARELVNEERDLVEIHATGLQEVLAKARVGVALGNQIEERLQRSQSIVDVVREAGGQDAERSQPLGLAELELEARLLLPQALALERFANHEGQYREVSLLLLHEVLGAELHRFDRQLDG